MFLAGIFRQGFTSFRVEALQSAQQLTRLEVACQAHYLGGLACPAAHGAFACEVVFTLRGGGLERGARITETGLAVLDAYREMERDAAALVDRPAYARLRASLRAEPLPPG